MISIDQIEATIQAGKGELSRTLRGTIFEPLEPECKNPYLRALSRFNPTNTGDSLRREFMRLAVRHGLKTSEETTTFAREQYLRAVRDHFDFHVEGGFLTSKDWDQFKRSNPKDNDLMTHEKEVLRAATHRMVKAFVEAAVPENERAYTRAIELFPKDLGMVSAAADTIRKWGEAIAQLEESVGLDAHDVAKLPVKESSADAMLEHLSSLREYVELKEMLEGNPKLSTEYVEDILESAKPRPLVGYEPDHGSYHDTEVPWIRLQGVDQMAKEDIKVRPNQKGPLSQPREGGVEAVWDGKADFIQPTRTFGHTPWYLKEEPH